MDSNAQRHIKQLEVLVAQRQDRLFRFAYMRIGRREDAEDLVQDVFVSAFRMIREGRELHDLDRYILRSISNACADYHRRSRETTVPIDEVEDMPACEADRSIHEEYRRVRALLDGLPPEQSEILRLKCYDELTFKQISELLDIPEATAKSRYRYAIKHVQDRLKS
ncbi:MAG: sigma-70 family RNA polymerase sigma factor [Muribaculum sp.]